MSAFLQDFLQDKPPDDGRGAAVCLGAFGKHPAWEDHFVPKLPTQSLTLAREKIYLEGIRHVVESRERNELPAGSRVELNHVLLWSRSNELLAGRLWASHDGTRERREYAMVVCAHCFGAPDTWVIRRVLPALEELGAACRAATSGDSQTAMQAEVLRLLADSEGKLQQTAPPKGSTPVEAALGPAARAEFVRSPDFGPNQERLRAVMHRLQERFFAYAPASQGRAVGDPLPQHLRLPLAASSAGDAFALWHTFLRPHLDASAPALLILPVAGGWMDLIVGEPAPNDFGCLVRGIDSLPMITAEETLTAEFEAKTSRIIEAFGTGETMPGLFSAEEQDKKETSFWKILRRALPEKPSGTQSFS